MSRYKGFGLERFRDSLRFRDASSSIDLAGRDRCEQVFVHTVRLVQRVIGRVPLDPS